MIRLIRLFLIYSISITLGYCADHNTFKNCSRVDFCTNLRTRKPADNYAIDPDSFSQDPGGITATLTSAIGDPDLSFSLSSQHNIYRLKITEVNSTRYELQDVLEAEPKLLNFDNVEIGTSSLKVAAASGFTLVVITYSPFNVEFIKNGFSVVVFNGDRLAMTMNDINAPFAFGVTFPEAVQLYGIHEHCDNLALQNTEPGGVDPYRLKNSDVGYYEINSPMALYGAVPVLYGHGPEATAGVFLHNAAEQWIEINNQEDGNSDAYFMADTGTLDLFILLGPTPSDVVRQYTGLTGTAHLPQLWTLGYHQSRNSYSPQDEVKEVIANFDTYNFQLDAIWLDIAYTDGYKYFTFNPTTFSDPVDLQETIASTNKKLVTIIDPHIKVQPGYDTYDTAIAGNFFVKNADGSVFEGDCWPGLSSWMDFLNPDARDFYASMYSYENFHNSTPTLAGIWNDMNEPSVFDNSLEMTLPADSLHGVVKHREIHNIYGLLHTMATHKGLIDRDNGERRPFILSRSHFAGSQRYAAIWTGDNQADWPYLAASFKQCLTANILGIVFCGSDVGGFMENPSIELLERWYQAAIWLPFFRAHSNDGTERREPYQFSDNVQTILRNAIQTRYKHLPVWYTLFYEHARTGDPIIRPLFYHYPKDIDVYKIDDQLLVGRDILVRCVAEDAVQSVQVYFPGGADEMWVSAEGDDVQAGNGYSQLPVNIESIPVYYRAGSIIVRKEIVRPNSVEMADDPHNLYAILNNNDTAHGTIYLDDNLSFNYRDSAEYNYINIDVKGEEMTISQIDKDSTGNFDFIVDQVTFIKITKIPEVGKPGTYTKKVYTGDANGNLLKDIKINLKEKTLLKLK